MRHKVLGDDLSEKIGGLLGVHKNQVARNDAGGILHRTSGKIRDPQNIQLAVGIFDCEILVIKLHGEFGSFERKTRVLLLAGNSADADGNIVSAAFQEFPITDGKSDK